MVCFVHCLAPQAHPGSGIAVDGLGRVFFTDGPLIVMLNTNGQARTIVHDLKNEKFYQLHHIRRAPGGGLITASDIGNGLWRFSPAGLLSRFYPPENGDRALRVGIGGDPFEVDGEGNIYSVNSLQYRFTQIVKTSPEGRIRVLAGGAWGFADGQGEQAEFANLHGASFLLAPDGSLFITDGGIRVRKVSPSGEVTTVAGGAESMHRDGPREASRFVRAAGMAWDAAGNLLVADAGGERIRSICSDGTVLTVAGSGITGRANGPCLKATFEGPTGIAVAHNGDIFVLEPERSRVRKISAGRVTTLCDGLP